jgi:modulator of FtsH protease
VRVIDLTPWHDVLIAASAAAATLAGLILTAMAVNIDAILKYPSLPSRAGSAIGSLVYVLVLTVTGLVPGVTAAGLGWLTLLLLLGPLAIQVDVMVRQYQIRPRQSFARVWSKIALAVGQIAPFVVSGILFLQGSALGLDWMIVGALVVFIGSVVNAWVLLVEIRR